MQNVLWLELFISSFRNCFILYSLSVRALSGRVLKGAFVLQAVV